MEAPDLKRVAVLTGIFSVIALTVCLWRAATKPVVIVDAAEVEEQIAEEKPEEAFQPEVNDTLLLSLQPQQDPDVDLQIPLPAGILSEDIRAENRYLYHQLWITLRTNRMIYDQMPIAADAEKIREAVCIRTGENEYCLRFGLTGLYEPETRLSDGSLSVKLRLPGEIYPHVILVDPIGGPSAADPGVAAAEEDPNQKDPALAAALKLAELFREDGDTQVYLTRQGAEWDEELAPLLLKETEADLCIRLRSDDSGGSDAICAAYNDQWYLRKYSNARFACDLAEEAAIAAGRPVAAIEAVGREDALLAVSTVPSATIGLGQDVDPALAAEGLHKALKEAYEVLE
ncbi:MAG: hypothetical protein IK096_02615 [Lachnospiraceae bacterium]|nr:hypothetical protein [Lachnospiraceae bacterium]